ncbi:synaptic vesicular amine transporter-like [Uloborus diversus]|uniref:synaptic vesicular amine transporter-like n=1 Tax=Uloborus diversus TaxID=327109 RepID=UPI002409BE4D|nr:synaptic vesicular amine transporter-like [Uloborus diversus]
MIWNNEIWKQQKATRSLIFIIYLSLFLDNMLLTVVVPIIPDVLYKLENMSFYKEDTNKTQNWSQFHEKQLGSFNLSENCSTSRKIRIPQDIINENEEVGLLFASKAIVQLIINPMVGPLTNRIGCTTPFFAGSLILVVSSLMFAHGETFSVLYAARSIQGIGSACISVAGMAMIADRYSDDKERSKVMGFAMGGIATGVLAGYPFGSITYDFMGKKAPLLVLSLLLMFNSAMLLLYLPPRLEPERFLVATSILKLVADPFIILASGAIFVSTLSIAVLEPFLPIWLVDKISPPRWQLGTVFIPDSIGYLIGTNMFGLIAYKIGRWFTALCSMLLIGISALMIPVSSRITQLVIPHFGLGLGIGVVDVSLMPLLAFLVDSRYVALYGSVYAIAQAAVCLSYSIGPLLGGYIVKNFGFPWLMRAIGIMNLLYCPLCCFLKMPAATEENKAIYLNGDNSGSDTSARNEGRREYSSFSNKD